MYKREETYWDKMRNDLKDNGLAIPQEKIVSTRTTKYFERANDYFRQYFARPWAIYSGRTGNTVMTHVRALVYTYYGVQSVTQMKMEDLEEANKLAINILKLIEGSEERLFEKENKIMNKKEKANKEQAKAVLTSALRALDDDETIISEKSYRNALKEAIDSIDKLLILDYLTDCEITEDSVKITLFGQTFDISGFKNEDID